VTSTALLLAFMLTTQEPPLWHVEQVLRIGSVEGDENYTLAHVGGLAVGPNNQLFVSQPAEHHIRVFDREGRFVRRIGREGGGPGEFRSISDISYVHGRLRVRDVGAGRVTDFSADGRVRATHVARAVRVEAPFYISPPVGLAADGSQYLMPTARATAGVSAFPFYVAAADGSVRQIGSVHEGGGTLVGRGERLVSVRRAPVSSRTLYAIDPRSGDVVFVERPAASSRGRHSWRLARVNLNGDTLLRRSYDYEAVPISRETVERALQKEIEARLRWLAESNFPTTREEVLAAARDGFRVPPFQAPVDELVIASTGELWLRRGSFGEDVAEWIALAADGTPIGRLRLPASARLAFATGAHIGLIEVDDLEVQYVTVNVLRRSNR
jgi:hypothetical protein